MDGSAKSVRINTVIGELQNHRIILARIKEALRVKNFSSIILFPTLSLLNSVLQEVLDDPGVPGIGGIRFLLFEGFMEEICQQFGINRRQPSSLERNLLIAQSFQRLNAAGELSYLARAPFTAGYRQAVLQGIAEWKRSQLTPAVFIRWAASKGPKEQQLALLYQDYQSLLTQYGFTEDDFILNELRCREKYTGVQRRWTVLLYGFTDLTQLQRDILNALSSWFDLEIILDLTGVPSFQKLSARYFGISFDSIPEANSIAEDIPSLEPFSETALALLQKCFWSSEPGDSGFVTADDSIGLLQTAGVHRQVAAIAREIARLYKEHPEYGIYDILILSPDPNRFIRIAAPIFKEYHIPLLEVPVPVIEYPSVNYIRNMIIAINNDWQWTDLAVLIRCFYERDPEAGDRLITIIAQRYGALSGRERWLQLIDDAHFKLYLHEAGLPMEPLLNGIARLQQIPTRGWLTGYLKAVQDFATVIIAEKAGQVFHDEKVDLRESRRRRFENNQAIRLIKNNIAELISFLENAPQWQIEMSSVEFLHFFNDFILDVEVEPFFEPGVRVLPPREARGLKAPVVFLTGLEQGVFPRTYINDWKLDIRSRFELKKKGIELETGEHYMLQERQAFYWALQSATQQLFLVFQYQDENGQPLNRSLFLDEVLEWVPELAARAKVYPLVPQLPEAFGDCLSDSEIRRCWARLLTRKQWEFPETEQAYFQSLFSSDFYRHLAGQIRKCHSRRPGPVLPLFQRPASFQWIARTFGAEFSFAITALEDYRECPYRFFLKHVLKTAPIFEPSILPTRLDVGSVLHEVLEDFGMKYRGSALHPEQAEEYQQYLTAYFNSRYREWREGAANELVKLLLKLQEKQIGRTLERWLNSELEWAEETRGRFHIQHVEYGFGLEKGDYDPDSIPYPYELKSDHYELKSDHKELKAAPPVAEIKIWGKIDRIDRDSAGNFIVYDYKSGRGPSFKNILNLDYLQIPVYIMALEQFFGLENAAGGCYLGLRQPSRNRGGAWRESKMNMPFAGGLSEPAWQDWLHQAQDVIRSNVQAIRQGVFNLVGEKCRPYCEYHDVCRRREWEEDGSDELSAESGTV